MIVQEWERPRLGQQGREGVRPPGLHRAPRSRRPPPMSRIDLKGDKQPISIRHLGVLGLQEVHHNYAYTQPIRRQITSTSMWYPRKKASVIWGKNSMSDGDVAKQCMTKRGGEDVASNMLILPRNRGEANSDYVYRLLKYNILMFIMPPGSLLRGVSIAESLGMSRTPVNQAVSLLKEQLLVDVEPQSATHVSRINVSAMRQGSLLRTEVEASTLYRMAGRLSSRYIERLQDSLAEQRAALDEPQPDLYKIASLDDEFHRIVFEGSNMEFTWRVLQTASTHYDRIRYMGLVYGLDDPREFYEDHVDFYKRLAFGTRHTEAQLYNYTYTHLNRYVDHFDKVVSEYPEYFDFGPVPGDRASDIIA